jgi:hypothetical protein
VIARRKLSGLGARSISPESFFDGLSKPLNQKWLLQGWSATKGFRDSDLAVTAGKYERQATVSDDIRYFFHQQD